MSADLFAAFGDAPAAEPQPKSGSGDLTAFSSFDLSASQSQAGSNTQAWTAPSNSNVWGDLGGLGGFQSQITTSAPPATQKPTVVQNEDEDEEGWGDFAVATPVHPPNPPAASTSNIRPKTRVLRASTIELMSNKLFDLDIENSAPQPSWQQPAKQPPPRPSRNPDPDVLFDADFEAENDLDEDDDFGEFEEVEAPPPVIKSAAPPPPVKPSQDLLSLDFDPIPPKKQPPGLTLSNTALTSNPMSYPQAPKSPYGSSFQDRKPEPAKALQVKPVTGIKDLKEANEASPSPVTAWPGGDEGFGNKWGPFEDEPVAVKPTTTTKAPAAKPLAKSKLSTKTTPAPAATGDWEWQDWGDSSQPTPSIQATAAKPSAESSAQSIQDLDAPSGPPPTNIPPPSVLLSLFPSLLDIANTSLLKPLLTLSPSSPGYQKVLASPKTLDFLKGYLVLATVAARIIAGRKHRWHRDKFLSQSMSISAATGVKGMKLQGLDKTQARREDGEAAEVLEVWKKQVGRLRSVVAGVNGVHSGENLKVPELALNMSVTVAKGALTDKKACVVCGLRREERVGKVDFEVEDSFGEWWVEFWGHRGCVNFWSGNEKELRGR
ncbi:hypothetical protein QBC38DRAFT_477234 [Podospora fimiseda]|uniref:Uncharacterized protein n=1 Tax=Podospora fimiseda TaxID=252190 RepID=A0AAN7GV91_9PEZI|nr:hypothetical protein QBC38DRAFT_477234 [Podospora fimiseda]